MNLQFILSDVFQRRIHFYRVIGMNLYMSDHKAKPRPNKTIDIIETILATNDRPQIIFVMNRLAWFQTHRCLEIHTRKFKRNFIYQVYPDGLTDERTDMDINRILFTIIES